MDRFLSIRQRQALVEINRETIKDAVLRTPVDKVRIRNGGLFANSFRPGAGVIERERDEFMWLVKRERPQQDGIEHAEDGRVCANAESEGQDHDSAEERLLEKRAKRMPKIAHENYSVRNATIGSTRLAR